MVETEFLYSGRIGFILGRRGKIYADSGVDKLLGFEAMESSSTLVNSRTANRLQQFATGGVDQHTMQRMCSLEYLERYFYYVLRKKSIDLAGPLFDSADEVPFKYKSVSGTLAATSQKLNSVDGEAVIRGISTAHNTNPPADVAKVVNSGIFAGDDGPFLRGKTLDSTLQTYRKNYQQASMGIGDQIAFEQLEKKLKDIGVMDWTPDGVVLSKLDSGGSDQIADDEIDARDGQLYNITIGGPAITSSWTGDPKLEVLPLDKLYIVLVGDVWTGKTQSDIEDVWEEDDAFLLKTTYKGATPKSYNDKFKAWVKNDNRNVELSMTTDTGARAKSFFKTNIPTKQTITNIRVERMTSSQMVSYSEYVKNADKSRMGFKIGDRGGEYILGGWCIGTVIDSAASRAIPNGMSLVGSVKRSRSAHAANLLVNIKWCSGDEMYRKYMNRPSLGSTGENTAGLLRSRYDMRRRAYDTFNGPATKR